MRISLGGSPQFLADMAKWRAANAQAASQERRGDNVQEAVMTPAGWLISRLHNRGQLDPDWIISDALHGTAPRYYTDWHFSRGEDSEVRRQREASFRSATAALGRRYAPTVRAIVLENVPLGTVGSARYQNRSAAGAFALEQLNQGLRRLAVHYGVLQSG